MGAIVSHIANLFSSGSTMGKVDIVVVQEMIDSDKVVIFSKTYCPYCNMAKNSFQKINQKFTVFELDERNDGAEIQNTLGDITGATSVPRVFVNGKFIGGGTDVQKMERNGSLTKLLE